jgi:uncharacterized membrane protein
MVKVGSVELLVFGFDGQRVLPPKLGRHLDQLRGRGLIRILDVLYVCKDAEGIFRADRVGVNVDAPSVPGESALWQLLVEDDPESDDLPAASPEYYRSCAVGLDLDAAEGLARLIEPGTSALLMLVEPKWTTELLDAVVTSGGFPIILGCLERETMLVIGPNVASSVAAASSSERVAAVRGAAMLDALSTAQPASTIATDVIPALVDARILDDSDVDDAICALAAAGLLSRSLVARARAHADSAAAEISLIGISGDGP